MNINLINNLNKKKNNNINIKDIKLGSENFFFNLNLVFESKNQLQMTFH